LPILWVLEWNGFTREQFDDLKSRVEWEARPPEGLHHQVTAFGDRSLVLTQVWQSPDHVLRFMEDRLLPAVRAMRIESMPRVDQYVVQAVYTRPPPG
jgi:hypothetical protein